MGRFELKLSKREMFHYNLVACNGQVLMNSNMYTKKKLAEDSIEAFKQAITLDQSFELLETPKGHPYFIIKALNGQIIAQSQMYSSNQARNNGVAVVIKHAKHAEIDDRTPE